jgi:glycosyltransferase involved in cell wall biosynthesis
MEWVIIDDSPAEESGSDKIVAFEEKFFPGKVRYIPLPKKISIGRKRNIGVKRSANEIILMMDDDDHYPQTSFRRRVAWLTNGGKPCAVCTSIALYDLQKGISAVNVPPFNLGLAARASEATLTFTKDFWLQRAFLEVDMAEGEEFLKGRESSIIEMPPQQIIVAFTHGKNTSSRRIPGSDGTNGCFWGFPKQFLYFVHGLAGVDIEES